MFTVRCAPGAALFLLASVLASPAAAQSAVEASLTVGFESRYMFRGLQFGNEAFNTTGEIGWNGLYAGVWFSEPLDKTTNPSIGFQEVDLFAGYQAPLSEAATLDIGLTYYAFPKYGDLIGNLYRERTGDGANTVEAFAGVSFDAPASPSLYVYHDFNVNTVTIEASASHSIPLTPTESTSLSFAAAVGKVFDNDDVFDYIYGSLSADVTQVLTPSTAISAGVRWSGSTIDGGGFFTPGDIDPSRSTGLWFGAALSLSL